MSTEYLTNPKIPSLAVLRAGLPPGVTIHTTPNRYTIPHLCLTDDTNYVFAFEPELEWLARFHSTHEPQVVFERFGANKIYGIFTKLSEAFGVAFVDEYGIDLEDYD